MKNARRWSLLSAIGLAAVAGSATNLRDTLNTRSVNVRAATAYRMKSLTERNGDYDGRRYQAALAARATMLTAQRRVQIHSSLQGRAAPAAPSDLKWTELGPGNVGGRINTIWMDPNSAQHMIIGAAGGGLWQSRDGGSSWTAIGEFPGSLAVGAIAQLPNGTLLVGTGDFFNQAQPGDGMFASMDGGSTWSPLAATAPQSNNSVWSWIDSITTNSNGVALAATWGGIARSADGGTTWVFVWPTAGTVNASRDVVFDPSNPSTAVADNEDGAAIYSVDSGRTWTLASGLPGTQHARTSLAFDSGVAGSVYALVDNNNATSPSGEVFHSTDGGKTWALLAGTAAFVNQHSGNGNGALCDDSLGGKAECQGDYDSVIGVMTQGGGKPPLIAVGGVDVFISSNGGTTWTETGSWLPSDTNYLHADQHAFAFSAGTGTAYAGNDGGLYKTPVAGGAWTPLNSGLAITQFYSVSGHAGASASGNKVNGVPIIPILAGAQDNGMLLYEGYRPAGAPQPNDWVQSISGDGGVALVDPVSGNNMYGEYVFLQPSFSITGGPNLQDMSPAPPDNGTQAANFIAPIALVPNGTSPATQMLAGGATLWLGDNVQTGAPTWTSLNNNTLPIGSNNNFISAVRLDPANNNHIWVGFDSGQVWHTTNAAAPTGPTWVRANVGSPATKVTSFWIVPGQSATVYATFAGLSNTNGSVFVTADGGQTWAGVGAALPTGPVFSLVTHPAYPQILYAGTLTGVYSSNDGGQTWNTSTQGPGNIAVNQLSWFDVSAPNQPVLLAATDGRGAWMGSPAYQPTPTLTSLTPAQALIGTPAMPITLNGTGFTNASSVTLDGSAIAAVYVSSTQLQIALSSALLATTGAHTMLVNNPLPGGGTSAGAVFSVVYPAPTITSMSPNTATVGAAGLTLTIIGNGFEPVSIVDWNGTALATTYVSSTEVTAMVPTANLSSAASASVTVVTAAPGGGASTALSFTVTAASSHGGGGMLGSGELLIGLGVIFLRGLRARFRPSL